MADKIAMTPHFSIYSNTDSSTAIDFSTTLDTPQKN